MSLFQLDYHKIHELHIYIDYHIAVYSHSASCNINTVATIKLNCICQYYRVVELQN